MLSKIQIPRAAKIVCKIISSISHKSEARIVGGYVRDILSEKTPNEIDMATNILPEDVIRIFSKNSIQTIPTGIQHGTVTVIVNNTPIEITTLRIDVMCDGRHAEVIFGDSWEEDAKRRDFTMNAMYADINGNIYDYFDGKEDIKNKVVRFIGHPKQRIHEDYLRIMRYFRFLGSFDYTDGIVLDHESFNAAVELSENLQYISAERIRSELVKTLSSTHKDFPIALMLKNGIFSNIGLNFQLANIDTLYFCNDPIINLAALFKLSDIQDLSILKTLKFSNKEQKIIYQLLNTEFSEIFDNILKKLLANKETSDDIHIVMQEIGKDTYINLFKMYCVIKIKTLKIDNIQSVFKSFEMILHRIQMEVIPITGIDIMKLGFEKEEIGNQLSAAKKIWLQHKCKIDKDTILRLLK